MTQDEITGENLKENEEKVINGIQQLLHNHLSTALDNVMKNFPDCRVHVTLPIALSRFIHWEILALQGWCGFTEHHWHEIFSLLLRKKFENKEPDNGTK